MSRATNKLREDVYYANRALVESGLVIKTFGNVSGIDRDEGIFVIKPSGVAYDELTPAHMVVISLASGEVLEGDLRPSSDTPTHRQLYLHFECGGVAHTHSEFATAFAQARRPIICTGTTHADYFRGDIPVTRPLTPAEVKGEYELNTGSVIVERFASLKSTPMEIPAVLVANHGPFAWGKSPSAAVDCAEALEYVARLAYHVVQLGGDVDTTTLGRGLIDRHFLRKHGGAAYYGQKDEASS
jgi:L-ribulose-5-phosphate 4-epimerase